jgi:alpha-L-arabinofuranosidase
MHDINLEGAVGVKSLYAAGSLDKASGDLILKVVNGDTRPIETEIALAGTVAVGATARVTVLTSASGDDENSLEAPDRVSPVVSTMAVSGNKLQRCFPGNSFTVLRIPLRR